MELLKRPFEHQFGVVRKGFPIICLVFFGVLSFNFSNAQSAEISEWKLLKESNGAEVFFKLEACDQSEFVHLRVVNKSDRSVTFDWSVQRLNLASNPKILEAGKVVSSECGSVSPDLSFRVPPDFSFYDLVVNVSKVD
jgi:hypothetical protein